MFRFSSIGDIVQLTSPLQTLRDQFPNARIDIITLDEYAEILIGHSFVNCIIQISRNFRYSQLKNIGKKIVEENLTRGCFWKLLRITTSIPVSRF